MPRVLMLHPAAAVPGLSGAPRLPPDMLRARDRLLPFPGEVLGGFARELAQPVEVQAPAFGTFHLAQGLVHGFRTFEAQGVAFNDISLVGDAAAETAAFAAKCRAGQTEDLAPGGRASVTGAVAAQPVAGALLLCSDEPSNFGSWLYRFLPKLLLALEEAPVRRVFAYAPLPWMQEVLRLAAPELEVVVHNPRVSHRLEDVLIPSLPAPHVLMRAEIRGHFDRLAAQAVAAGGAEVPERLYVSRRLQALRRPGYRVLENETELVERLRERGFTEFIPEVHPLAEQIRVFAQARVIISPGGANLFPVLFARRAELVVGIEAMPDWLFAHTNLLSSSGCAFTVAKGVPGPRGAPPHSNFALDVDGFLDGLRVLGVA